MVNKCESKLSILNGNKVWLMLGISLVVLALVLTLLSTIYLRYVNESTRHWPLMDFANLLHNSSFLLSHLTNQGIILRFYNIQSLITKLSNTIGFDYILILRLPVRSAIEIPRQLFVGSYVVSHVCRLGQRLRWRTVFVLIRSEVGTSS